MKDKINRLAKGILDLETPELMLTPESLCDTVPTGRISSFIIELQSRNGYTVKGISVSDHLRVHSEPESFAGRCVHITVRLNTAGLRGGDVVKGEISLITNAGEFAVPYEFTAEQAEEGIGSTDMPEPEDICENPVCFQEELPAEDREDFSDLPEDEDAFLDMVTELIRSEDESPAAYRVYKEAIQRGLSVNRLYESYVLAYPDDSTEEMLREVLLYFSFDPEIPHSICEKLYANIVVHQDVSGEIFESFSARMGRFAAEEASDMQMNSRLALIYDRMTAPEMVDQRSAKVLQDLFRCHEIRVTEGSADFLLVTYPELKTALRSPVLNGISYVPIYSDDAEVRFYREEDSCSSFAGEAAASARYIEEGAENGPCYREVSDEIRYDDRKLFNRPDVLKACAGVLPDQDAELLSDIRRISKKESCSEKEKETVTAAMQILSLNTAYRNRLISILSETPGNMDWISSLRAEDLTFEACGSLFPALVREKRFGDAYDLIRCFGAEYAEPEDMKLLLAGLLEDMDSCRGDEICRKLCKKLLDIEMAPDPAVGLLCADYSGRAADMAALLREAEKRKLPLYDLAERMLTTELFSGESEGIDEAFSAYIQTDSPDDLVVRAYLAVRSADYFLRETEVSEVLFENLFQALSDSENPSQLPEICPIALTRYYSERTAMTEKEKELCQKLVDRLIEAGLVFRYTKELRRNIRIPQEIVNRYYLEYRGHLNAAPKLLVKILPDEQDYHAEEMTRVFSNVYVMSAVLFIGDELHYMIFDTHSAPEAAEEGQIRVTKLHHQANERMRCINNMMKAIRDRDEDLLKENMLRYVENSETVKALFKLEK